MTYFRLIKILWIFAHYRLDIFFPKKFKARWLIHFFVMFNPIAWFARTTSRGTRLRKALLTLGPIFVKFGQVLSTRPDLLPQDIITELTKLQDQVPPFAEKQVKAILNVAYQKPYYDIFKQFDLHALASASIAQVHAAQLTTGEQVVVKIVRPNIKKLITRDVQILYLLARLANKFLPNAEYFHCEEVVTEFETTLFDELDMHIEAENAARLRNNFNDSNIMYVPKIYWPYVRSNVLVMERIFGIRISDIETLNAKNIDLKKLAEYGVEIFYTQVFRDQFFHADMHPGNIFVNIDDSNNPYYCGIDFGIMGTLSADDQYYMSENFLAFFNRDYHRVAQLHVDSGWVPNTISITDFENDLRIIMDPMFKKPLNEISFGQVLINLLHVAQKYQMHVQPQLILLQKTLLNVEGLGRQLYPELDLWATAKPHLERIMGKRLGFDSKLNFMQQQLSNFSCDLNTLPNTIKSIIALVTSA